MSVSEAWAVRDEEGLKVRTVSDTRRAAIINWLVTECRVKITPDMSDDRIERQWQIWRGPAEAMPIRITALSA